MLTLHSKRSVVPWMRLVRSDGWEGFSARSSSLFLSCFFSCAARPLKCFYPVNFFPEFIQGVLWIDHHRHDADGTVLLEDVQFIAFGQTELDNDFSWNCDLALLIERDIPVPGNIIDRYIRRASETDNDEEEELPFN